MVSQSTAAASFTSIISSFEHRNLKTLLFDEDMMMFEETLNRCELIEKRVEDGDIYILEDFS